MRWRALPSCRVQFSLEGDLAAGQQVDEVFRARGNQRHVAFSQGRWVAAGVHDDEPQKTRAAGVGCEVV